MNGHFKHFKQRRLLLLVPAVLALAACGGHKPVATDAQVVATIRAGDHTDGIYVSRYQCVSLDAAGRHFTCFVYRHPDSTVAAWHYKVTCDTKTCEWQRVRTYTPAYVPPAAAPTPAPAPVPCTKSTPYCTPTPLDQLN